MIIEVTTEPHRGESLLHEDRLLALIKMACINAGLQINFRLVNPPANMENPNGKDEG